MKKIIKKKSQIYFLRLVLEKEYYNFYVKYCTRFGSKYNNIIDYFEDNWRQF